MYLFSTIIKRLADILYSAADKGLVDDFKVLKILKVSRSHIRAKGETSIVVQQAQSLSEILDSANSANQAKILDRMNFYYPVEEINDDNT